MGELEKFVYFDAKLNTSKKKKQSKWEKSIQGYRNVAIFSCATSVFFMFIATRETGILCEQILRAEKKNDNISNPIDGVRSTSNMPLNSLFNGK